MVALLKTFITWPHMLTQNILPVSSCTKNLNTPGHTAHFTKCVISPHLHVRWTLSSNRRPRWECGVGHIFSSWLLRRFFGVRNRPGLKHLHVFQNFRQAIWICCRLNIALVLSEFNRFWCERRQSIIHVMIRHRAVCVYVSNGVLRALVARQKAVAICFDSGGTRRVALRPNRRTRCSVEAPLFSVVRALPGSQVGLWRRPQKDACYQLHCQRSALQHISVHQTKRCRAYVRHNHRSNSRKKEKYAFFCRS